MSSEQRSVPATTRQAGRRHYGGPEVIELTTVDVPAVGPRAVLVEVVAAAVNPLDWHLMTGTPWLVRLRGGLRRPSSFGLGVDVAGRVVAVGEEVDGFSVGDEVMGMADGAFAGHVAVPAAKLVPKPAAVGFEEAAGMGVAGITALQGLRDKGGLQAGQKVLINGASGGVGTVAVQLAKWLGAEVTAVCSTRNVDLVRSLGADRVVDYTTDDFVETDERYDLFFDNQGNRPLGRCRRLLAEDGVYLAVGGPKRNRLVGPLGRTMLGLVRFRFGNGRTTLFLAEADGGDLATLIGLMADGRLRTVIDTVHPLDELATAMDRLADGHVRGKLIVTP